MSQNIYLMVFGTFGNPNGFRQNLIRVSNENIKLDVKTFDLKTDAITLFPNSNIYAIRKEVVNGNKAFSYSIYSYAKEKNSDRGGTFIGSSMIFLNSISSSKLIINCLNDLQNTLLANNVLNDTIQVNHSEEFVITQLPRDFNQLNYSLKEITDVNFQQFTNKIAVVYNNTDAETMQVLLEKSISLLNVYDTVYFTESLDIANYVMKKRIFNILDASKFENEIQKIEEERVKKIESSIIELQNDKIFFENEKLRNIENLKKLIEQSERIHQDNKKRIDESRHELNQINNRYNGFYNKIDELINKLKLGQSYTEIRIQHSENRRRFIDSINQNNSNATINTVDTNRNKNTPQQVYGRSHEESSSFRQKESEKDNSYIFIASSIILFFLWAGTLIYFLWFKPPEIIISSEMTQQETQIEPEKLSSNVKEEVKNIDPINNSELSPKEYKAIAKKLKHGMTLNEIVDIIFDSSPNTIKAIYGEQKEAYGRLILDLNKDCFITNEDKTIFSKDSLTHVPFFKKP